MTPSPGHVRPRRASLKWRRTLPVSVAALAVLIPSGAIAATKAPPTPSPSAASRPASTLTVGTTQDVDSLNPFVGILATSYEVYQMAYDTLTNYSAKDFSPTPGLAGPWKTSPDGLTWTYTIRSGVKWSDGVPLTAHDVAYTFNRIMHGSYEQTNFGNYTANIASVTAPNDTTVIMRTKKRSPSMLALGVYILPEHIWKHVSEKSVGTFKNTAMVGSGPFIMEERQTGQFVRLKANPNYWGGAPHVSQVVFRIFNDQDAMVQALRKGEIDFADNLQASLYKSLNNAPNIKQVPAVYTAFDEIGMNTGAATASGQPIGDGNPALKNVAVRQAINWAINRQTLVTRVLDGYGQVGTTIIPPIYANEHYQPAAGELYTYNPTKAGQILDAAGFKKDSHGIRVDPNTGKEITLRLFGRSDSQPSRQTVQFVQSWLQAIGFKITVKILSEDNLDQIIGDGDYDLFEFGWVDEPDPDYQLLNDDVRTTQHQERQVLHRRFVGQLLLQPGLRRALQQAEVADQHPGADADGEGGAEDRIRPGSLRRHLLLRRPRGLSQRPLHRLGSAADRHGRDAVPVGRVELSQRATSGFCQRIDESSDSSSNPTVWVLVGIVVVALIGGAFMFGRRRGTADDRE